MIDLNKNVLGKIKAREVLGAEPDIDIIKNMLEKEIRLVIENLENLTKQEFVVENKTNGFGSKCKF